jgi:hypothetical protein
VTRKAKAKPEPRPREHHPKPGRRAYLCSHKDAKTGEPDCHERRFMRPGERPPDCPHHGTALAPQANRPYRGQVIPA